MRTKSVFQSRPHNQQRSSKAFTLIELVSVLAVCASVTAVLAPSMKGMRSQMRGVTSEGNLSTIGQAGAMYALDNNNRIFSYSWVAGEKYPNLFNGNFRVADSDFEAITWQAQNILQRATGRIRGVGRIITPSSRLMSRAYSHLPLADYLGGNVSDPLWADPADSNLLHWQQNPLDFDEGNSFPYGNGLPDQAGYDDNGNWPNRSNVQLWPFSSSYQTVPHSWQQDFGNQYIPITDTPHLFSFTTTPPLNPTPQLGNRRYNEVRFPSAKVHMYEEFDREQAGSPYFSYDHAQSAKLMFDGSINTAMSGLAQSSVSPADYINGDKFVWEQTYVPLDTFPLPLGGLGDQTLLNQRFRWTLGGLQGIDYAQTLFGR
ncbi:MAG: type II secretion system protein [Phycisphaerales bacterium]